MRISALYRGYMSVLVLISLVIMVESAPELQKNIRLLTTVHQLTKLVPSNDNFLSAFCDPSSSGDIQVNSVQKRGFSSIEWGCSTLLQSKVACASGDLAEAQKWYEVAKRSCIRTDLIYEWQGQLAWAEGKHEQAINIWFKLPNTIRYLAGQAFFHSNQGDNEVSRLILEALLPEYASELETYQIRRAYDILDQGYMNEGDIKNSLRVRKEMVDIDPGRVSNWIKLGDALYKNGDLEQSLKVLYYTLALVDAEENPYLAGWTYLTLGHTQAAMQDYSEAMESFNTALDWYILSERATDSQEEYIKRRISQWKSNVIGSRD